MKKRLRLTEAQLRGLVARATASVLNEMGGAPVYGQQFDSQGRPKFNDKGQPVMNPWRYNSNGSPKTKNGQLLDKNGRPQYNANGSPSLDPLFYDRGGRPIYNETGQMIDRDGNPMYYDDGTPWLDPTRYDAQGRPTYMQ